jgi:hypothetical protein
MNLSSPAIPEQLLRKRVVTGVFFLLALLAAYNPCCS